MPATHTLTDGRTIVLHIKRNTCTHLIVRPRDGGSIYLGIPPWLPEKEWRRWLAAHENVLQDILAKGQARPRTAATAQQAAPESIWLYGRPHALASHDAADIRIVDECILLPQAAWPEQQQRLRQHLYQLAAADLLPRLNDHAQRTGLHPAATALTRAKTFWGVCRPHSGIRLNWRLIGAPPQVADYVCVHELCHLRHADHSRAFWALVDTHTPHTAAAKQWLKRHGSELFVLG
ncbi:putative metal-dependent hydrolase [Neisseria sp. HSC-16F19]|nr:SprT family zinc-dependent metalloprotease [Neisseria sp. HSC-16F19]MCP2040092.1 putative metal-dependent hydrolase [Neisseria sp. HSC-16F19]